MKTLVLSPHQLTEQHIAAWRALLDQYRCFRSPFLSPAYVLAMEPFHPQVRVAVLEDAEGRMGFFPFDALGKRTGYPLGLKLADFQGVIAPPELNWTERDLHEASGLSVIVFDHLLASQASRFKGTPVLADSPYIDLSKGYEGYAADRKAAGSTWLTKIDQKLRKLRRDHPSLEFCWNDTRQDSFDLLMKWKTEQRQRTNTFNVLEIPWIPEFLNSLRTTSDPYVSAVISTLRVDGKVVAAHYGLRRNDHLHYWFPSYDQAFGEYSPGLILLAMVAREAAPQGIHKIDLGKGDDPYKEKFANGCEQVATIFSDRFSIRRILRNTAYRFGRWIKSTSFRAPLVAARRFLQRRSMNCLLH